MSIGPFAGKTEFLAHYEESRIRNAIGALPPTNAAVESAFPERFAPLITHSRPLDRIGEAFALLERYEDGVGKIIIRPDE